VLATYRGVFPSFEDEIFSLPESRRDYTVTLTPAGGVSEHYGLVLEDPAPNATALFINDDAFLKKDGREVF